MEGYVLFDENELKKHFKIIKNKATGNCLFESLAQNMLYFNEGETIPFRDSRYGQVLTLAKKLRQDVCDFYLQFIRQHQGLANFPGTEQSKINYLITTNLLIYNDVDEHYNHSKYICNDNEWGDIVDALIICKLYECNLTIYRRIRKETYKFLNFTNNTESQTQTYCIRHFNMYDPNSGEGNHFEACIPISTPIPIPKQPDEKSKNKTIEPQIKIQKEKSTPSREKPPPQPPTPILEKSTLSHEKSPNKTNEQSKSIENLNFDDFNELFKEIIIRDYENDQNFDDDLKSTIATAIDRNKNEHQDKIVYDLMWDLNDSDFKKIKDKFTEATNPRPSVGPGHVAVTSTSIPRNHPEEEPEASRPPSLPPSGSKGLQLVTKPSETNPNKRKSETKLHSKKRRKTLNYKA